jgi:hypothetical protein
MKVFRMDDFFIHNQRNNFKLSIFYTFIINH